ncbi:GAF domain-containing sensor histidine kinase [Rossellomorea vietnamensis]|uniref:histidine kinase n=1 Tax=Rossellomorea vietnamensis TaxID=218284 RepID=A0A5D4MD17_9BACI|nr:GAF domain-containing sensor histidine kinase [Rossellomorea vietnamensis]TYR98860.1 GAF domain-containing sensor histidine kinase [Rossellomorea vietnamensis]
MLSFIKERPPVTDLSANFFTINHDFTIAFAYIEDFSYLFSTGDLVGRSIREVLQEGYTADDWIYPERRKPYTMECYAESRKASFMIKVFPSGSSWFLVLEDNTTIKNVEEVLGESNREVTSLAGRAYDVLLRNEEPRQIFDKLFDYLSQHLDLDVYFNYIVNESHNKIELMNFQGIPEEMAQGMRFLNYGEAVCGTVALTGERRIEEEIQQNMNEMVSFIKSMGIKSYACHPLVAHGELIGTLSFGSKTKERFRPDEIHLLKLICERAALALERTSIITSLKNRNQELALLNRTLETEKEKSQQANTAKTDFLLLVSHEFRTPLNTLQGFTEILLENSDQTFSPFQISLLNSIYKAGEQLEEMTTEVMEFVRTGQSKSVIEPVEISRVLKKWAGAYFGLTSSDPLPELIFQNGLMEGTEVLIDQNSLELVLKQLISNAVKYNRSNNEILLKSSLVGQNLLLTVEDRGIGIRSEDLPHLFTPFFRSKANQPAIEGLGIGLAIVERAVNKMGGKIKVSSKVKEGTIFKLYIPIP